jgi:DNA primase
VIEAAKEAVPVVDLADLLCGSGGLRKVGNRWVGRCPLPDHEDRSPSFTVYPETNSWFCYGCLRGGDVIELARYAWGYEKSEVKMAAADVLHQFGHEIPPRRASWFAKQKRQQEVRQGLNEVKARTVQRRLFWLFERYLSPIEDPNVRLAEAETIYAELYPIACLIVARIEGRGL